MVFPNAKIMPATLQIIQKWFGKCDKEMKRPFSPRGAVLMHFLIIIVFLFVGLVKGPPPWLNSEVSKAFRLKHLSQTPSPSPMTCRYPNDQMDTILKEREFLCASENNIWDSVVVQLLVRGPDKQCEHGSMCSVKVGSKLQIEVSLSAAPPSLGLSLALCFLSPSSNPFNDSRTMLVVNGCPADVGVSLPMVPPLPCTKALLMKTFNFRLAPFYNNSIQFLHCRVQLCYKEKACSGSARSKNIPECRNPEDLCTRISAAPLHLKPGLQRTVTQPLLVTISAPTRPLVQSSIGHKKTAASKVQESAVHGIGIAGVVSITLSSFFIGMIMTAGLWCIHSKTAPINQVT
ncbi:transforming growth factor-beta receptor type 3-like protein [Eleutherodactylus coqui]|uniref:transforming growth factor-beta receptor type 3-like protein n=1 Tax=Eleutherodactylus coqui TaxID=57060 RepID=UPI0034626F2E